MRVDALYPTVNHGYAPARWLMLIRCGVKFKQSTHSGCFFQVDFDNYLDYYVHVDAINFTLLVDHGLYDYNWEYDVKFHYYGSLGVQSVKANVSIDNTFVICFPTQTLGNSCVLEQRPPRR